jgi:hypothetical protein
MLHLLFTNAQASWDRFELGIKHLENGDLTKAQIEFREIDVKSPLFLPAFKTLQKIHYKLELWDRLFAYSYFYKVHFWKTKKLSNQKFDPEVWILESLALSKLCRYEDGLISLLNLKHVAKEINVELPYTVEQSESFLVGSIKVDGFKKISNKTFEPLSAISRDSFWKIDDAQTLKLDNPKYLRMNVKSQCKK